MPTHYVDKQTYQGELDRAMSESAWQAEVIAILGEAGFLRVHFRPARLEGDRWVTAIQGDKGFPDTIAAGHGRILFIECKSEHGRLTPDERRWITALEAAHTEVYILRPSQRQLLHDLITAGIASK